jgi:hypothetical protein
MKFMMICPLTRRHWRRYPDGDPESRQAIDESAAWLVKNDARFNTLLEAMDALRQATFNGPPDPPETGPITTATFRHAIVEREAAERIMAAVAERRLTNPNFTDRDLYAEVVAAEARTGRGVA